MSLMFVGWGIFLAAYSGMDENTIKSAQFLIIRKRYSWLLKNVDINIIWKWRLILKTFTNSGFMERHSQKRLLRWKMINVYRYTDKYSENILSSHISKMQKMLSTPTCLIEAMVSAGVIINQRQFDALANVTLAHVSAEQPQPVQDSCHNDSWVVGGSLPCAISLFGCRSLCLYFFHRWR